MGQSKCSDREESSVKNQFGCGIGDFLHEKYFLGGCEWAEVVTARDRAGGGGFLQGILLDTDWISFFQHAIDFRELLRFMQLVLELCLTVTLLVLYSEAVPSIRLHQSQTFALNKPEKLNDEVRSVRA